MPKTRYVFVVCSGDSYEPSVSIAAFLDHKEAEAFEKQCNDHQLLMPADPEFIQGSIENHKEFERFDVLKEKWAKKHPAGVEQARLYNISTNFHIDKVVLKSIGTKKQRTAAKPDEST